MPLLQIQEELREKTGSKAKRNFVPKVIDADFRSSAESLVTPLIQKAMSMRIKQDRYAGFDEAKKAAKAGFAQLMPMPARPAYENCNLSGMMRRH